MQRIIAPTNKRLVWYLAMEEYLAQHVDDTDIFFTWVVAPTVIFGRHQVMTDEVNIPFCQAHGIQMYRRKSGGGCVYADQGNLMTSYITSNTHSEKVFQQYLDMMATTLHSLGYEAVKTEHNDILVDGHKVSGNACYALSTGTIVHGTMLYDVNFEMLQQAITPSVEKLSKHGVQSVRQRVANLKSLPCTAVPQPQLSLSNNDNPTTCPIQTINDLADYCAATLCNQTRQLTPVEISAIDNIEQTYLDPDFIAAPSIR